MASGRIVVVAGLQGAIGAASAVVGLGPLLEQAELGERAVGLGGIALGTVMVLAALSLGLRRGPARALGLAGALSMVTLGFLVVLLSATSLGTCDARNDQEMACRVVIAAISVVGVAIAATGAASVVILRRARLDAFRRHLRR